MTGALQGLRVLDMGQWIAAPYCTAMLADFGAEVIKIEKPGGGDDQRHSSPFVDGQSAFFNLFNRNKHSVTIDLSTPAGRAQCRDLIGSADVLVENYRPGVMARLGLDYATLHAEFPRLVYCSISGFGQSGPMRGEGGFDLVIQAMSGLAAQCGPTDGPAHRLPIPIVDVSTALFATIGVLTALAARQQTGTGQLVDVALLDSALAMAPLEVADYLATGHNPERMGQASRNAAPYQIFRTQDGAIALGAASQGLWEKTCDLLDRPALKNDPRFADNTARLAHRAVLAELVEQALATQPSEHWLARLREAGIPAGPVLSYADILRHPQVAAREMVRRPETAGAATAATLASPIRLSDTPARFVSGAPALGAHNGLLASGTRTGPPA
ncbi:CoA transferase [Bordetella parapertussis]|uniref:CoA transferase n=5 Tax=Bordetella TaxID=517 RepID=A0A0H3LM05_BORBR|nr:MULTISPECIES: CoA transferase [Bordetella]KAK64886.1 CoA-transferase family III protein [Bordetella bronchiseptica 980-2]SHS70658.1 L-carnitine dehydratase/bile acid-inducible protein F [Mycobacteroides abscessus subsp. abscessus]AMG88643.1 CoA transferase [Bordetella bronchiseptica]AOB38534.1 hypothetical protein BBB43_06535 [Bordetella parapertussis]AUL42522.1 CoA transferase [Bordetella parapertussis]